jgi:DNA ligase-1
MSAAPDLFKAFAETLEKVRLTSSKNSKRDLLAEYFSKLPEGALASAARFLVGREASHGDIGVGWRAIMDALREVVAIDDAELSDGYLKLGDLGSVVEEIYERSARARSLTSEPLTITRVSEAFDEMARTAGSGSTSVKKRILQGLLADAEPVEAKYLIRIITGDLRVGATQGIVEEGVAKAFSVDAAAVRNAILVTGDVAQAARLAKRGEVDGARPVLYRPVAFMLAEPKATAPEVAEHFGRPTKVEMKYDGIRLQAHLGSDVKLFSRRMEDVTVTLPEVKEALMGAGHEAILDGEALGFDGEKPIPFVKLQSRLHRKELTPRLMNEAPVYYFVFDVLYLDGEPLLGRSLLERREALLRLQLGGRVVVAPQYDAVSAEDYQRLFDGSRKMGFEGLVVKDPASPYTPGRRGGHWVKLKKELDTVDAVIVAAEWGNGKRAGLLSDYTFAVWDGADLKVIGKAYSGLTDEEIAEMTDRMKELAVRWEGHRCVVKPQVVLEVSFDSIQRSDRHDSGYALRFPRIKEVRHDKGPDQADTLEKVRSIYEHQGLK